MKRWAEGEKAWIVKSRKSCAEDLELIRVKVDSCETGDGESGLRSCAGREVDV